MSQLVTIDQINARLEATVHKCLARHVFTFENDSFTRKVAKQCQRVFEEFGAGPDVMNVTLLDDNAGVQVYYRLQDYENTIEGKVSSA